MIFLQNCKKHSFYHQRYFITLFVPTLETGIIWLAMVAVTVLTTPLCEMCLPKGRNFMSRNP